MTWPCANLRVMAAVGLFDPPELRGKGSIETLEHLAAARQIEAAACVLLKNDKDLLPLDGSKIKSIAVIRSNAKTPFARDGLSAVVTTRHEVTALEGITVRAGAGVKVTYADGYVPAGRNRRPGGSGRQAQRKCHAADARAPGRHGWSHARRSRRNRGPSGRGHRGGGNYRWQDQETADRSSLKLPAGQAEVIQRVGGQPAHGGGLDRRRAAGDGPLAGPDAGGDANVVRRQ